MDVKLPDGRIIRNVPDGTTKAQLLSKLKSNGIPLPPGYEDTEEQAGVFESLKKGAESTLSNIVTGAQGIFSPEEAAKRSVAEGERIGSEYGYTTSLDKVKEAYSQAGEGLSGILAGGKEALSQVPGAIAEQVPQLGAMLAGGKAGAALGSLAGPVGTVVGGTLGALAPSFLQIYGSNLGRQEQEGQDIEALKAAGAAVPAAAIDLVAGKITLGKTLWSKALGIPEKELAGEAAEAVVRDGIIKAATKGAGKSAATEIPTEVVQQGLERLQAGLPLADDEAFAEYADAGYAALLASPIGAAGGIADRAPTDTTPTPPGLDAPLDEIEQKRIANRQRREQEALLEENVKQESKAKEGEKLLRQEEREAAKIESERSKQVQAMLKEQDAAKRQARMEALQAAFPADYSDVTDYATLVRERAAAETMPKSKERDAIIRAITARTRQMDRDMLTPAQAAPTDQEVLTPEQMARRQQAQEGFDGVGQQELFPLPREMVLAEQERKAEAPASAAPAAPVSDTVLTKDILVSMGFPKQSVIVKRYAETDLANADVQMAIAADLRRARENTRMNQDAVNTLANTVQRVRKETDAGVQPALTEYDDADIKLTADEEPKVRKQVKPRDLMQQAQQQPSKLDSESLTADDVITEADIARITQNPQVFGASNMPKLRRLILGKTPKQIAAEFDADKSSGAYLQGMFKGTAIFDRLVQPFRETENAKSSSDVRSGRSTPVNQPNPANVRPDGAGQGSRGQGVDGPAGPSVGVRGGDTVVDGRRSTVRDEALAEKWDEMYGMDDVKYIDLSDDLKTRFKDAVDDGYVTIDIADEIAAAARKNKRVEAESKLVEKAPQPEDIEVPEGFTPTTGRAVVKRKRRTKEEIVADQQAKAAAKAKREQEKADNQERIQKEKEAKARAAKMAQEEKRAKKQEDEDVDRLIQAAAKAKAKASRISKEGKAGLPKLPAETRKSLDDAKIKREVSKIAKKEEKKAEQEKPAPVRTAAEKAQDDWKQFEDKGAPAWGTLTKKQQKQWTDAVKEGRGDLFTANKIVSPAPDPDAPLYSKRIGAPVAGMDADRVQEIVDQVKTAYPNTPPIIVVQRQSDISPKMLKDYFDDIEQSKGFLNMDDGKIYILPDNLTGEKDVVLTFVHEVVGHYGLRAVLGDQYSMIMAAAKKNALIKQEMGNDKPTERNIEEALARISERAVDNKLPKPLLPFMTRIVAAVKNYLRKAGMNVALSNQEVYTLLADARAYTKTGARKGKGEAPRPDSKSIMQRTEREGTTQADLDAMKDATGSIAPVRRTEESTREAVTAVAKKVLTPSRSTLEFRVKAVDRSASVVDKLSRFFGTKLQDSLGNLNPIPLLRQAEAATRLMEAVFDKGGAAFDAVGNIFKAVEIKITDPTSSLEAGTPASVKGMFKTIKDFAAARNLSLADAEGYMHRVFEGRRYKWMRAQNAKTEATAAKMKGAEAQQYLEDNLMVLPTNIDVDAMIAQSDKAFRDEDYVRQYDDIMRAVREHAVQQAMDAGVLSKEQGAQWMQATEYVPFNRLSEEFDQKSVNMVARGLTSFSNIRKLVGSENKPIGNISDNFANTIGWLTSQTLRNKAAQQIIVELEAQDYARKMKGPKDFEDKSAVVRILEGGKETYYELADPLDVNAFASLPMVTGPGMKILQNSTRFLRASVTLMPQFAISQVIQDAQRAAFHSGAKNPFKVMGSTLMNFPVVLAIEALGPNHAFVRGIKAMQRKANQIQALKDAGVVGQYDLNPVNPAENIRYETGLARRNGFNKFLKAAETFTTASDMAARLAVFEQIQKDFPNDAVRPQVAARELINFNRRGSSSTVGFLITAIPFFNAYMQSMDLMYRNFKSGVDTGSGLSKAEMRSHLVKTAAMMTTIGLAYAMMMQDDEEYKKTPDVIKDRNWILPGGIAIPMPPELGLFFKVFPERMVQYYQRSGTAEEQKASEAVGQAFKSMFNAYASPNPTPQLVKPLLEAWTNYSFFTGRPIVPQSMQDIEPWLRYGAETSTFAMEVGKMFNVAPLMVDQVVNSTFGMAGTTAVQLVDAMTTDRGDRPLYRYPLISTFVKSPEGSQYVNEFYDFREKTARVKRTFDKLAETSPDEAMAYLEKGDNADLYAYDKYVSKVLKELSEIRKYRKFVQETDTMTGEEKRREIDAMDALRNELVADIREIKADLGSR